jgi:hypothetical protein
MGLEAWCQSNNPLRLGFQHTLTKEHLTLFANTLEATDGASHTVSGASLVGNDGPGAVNSSLQAKLNLPTDGSNPSTSNPFVQAFVKAPAAGATTMLDMARLSAGFNPLDPKNANNVSAFTAYLNEVSRNPMFFLEMVDRRTLSIQESDFNKLISGIADLFEGLSREDLVKIKESLTSLAQAATSTKDVRQNTDLFAQSAVKVENGSTRLYIYYSSVAMIEHQGKSTTQQTDYTVMRTRLRFQHEFWNEVTAGAVAQRHFKDLSDWVEGNATKPGDDQPNGQPGMNRSKLCFEV